jgi:hypothetical protein
MKKIKPKELIESTAKSIFGVVPFGGALLDEIFFEYNGRIKQNRLNNFIQILADNFTEDADINLDNIKTEDFNDLFEAVLRRVVQTKSKLKLLRFKDILIKELNNPSEKAELIDHYLDLISSLTEEEIIILYNHRHFTDEFEEEINELNRLKDNLHSLENQIKNQRLTIGESEFKKPQETVRLKLEKKKKYIDSFLKYKKADFYDLSENSFIFYKQRLFSKGLLIDNRSNRVGNLPFGHMGITEFGNEFIDFIKNSAE